MHGVFTVVEGQEIFGPTAVGTWSGERWCLRSPHDAVIAIMSGGWIGDSLRLEGYVRVVRSGRAWTIALRIDSEQDNAAVRSGDVTAAVRLVGHAGDGHRIVMQRTRPISTMNTETQVIAHRAGGRNSDRLGCSENSIPMAILAERLGATGVEIDVKVTRDGHVIVFHDETFSPRTVDGNVLLGRVNAFDLYHIQHYGTLINGERIPTLKEMLQAIIERTELRFVWIDVKDAAAINGTILAQRAALDHARSRRRDVQILIGVATAEIHAALKRHPDAATVPYLYELDAETALQDPMCRIWAPRWTNGIPTGYTERFRALDKQVFTWTLDVREYIDDFIASGAVDGVLTNYPMLVSGMLLQRE
jgi:glycerophosphoryl diester phosphodiesterase